MIAQTKPPATGTAAPWHDDAGYLHKLRRDLLRFAQLQLRDSAAAEDAVQEALAAAWASEQHFAGQSQHKTWVFGILRHKLIDTMRAKKRTINLSSLSSEIEGEEILDSLLFDPGGHWAQHSKPQPWPKPETALQQKQFWVLFETCLDHLPEQTGRVFMMREFLGLETGDICDELTVSANHCSVLLYRARLKLRTCLSEKGYCEEDGNGEL
ncbi:ECF RNA polymerase sigma factor SigG [Andreprevotia sp. IGB-42]|uniref:RNA polymerase factor sigma-70 n=1 Tax=Andreprevotia sp. IGB-42 TaxID=2497473 RepID=UPI001356EE50|nr:RNA polymerase factor sigma-70 [Andreprevotia sp. IGB-42]KAF0814060.1 ECF RNA polymerase sigma factor SigG [Andreprevotia sp. IGB-42]